MRADTQTITIDVTPSQVFRFVANPESLPRWARAFCQAIRPDGDAWLVHSPQGDVRVRYQTDEARGVIDFHLSPAPGAEALAASRVLPNGTGAEYVFTQFQPLGMSDDVFSAQVHALREELVILKALLEGRRVDAAPSCAAQTSPER
jgi:polyketide cyclase/dehydrase/lipid transport protein